MYGSRNTTRLAAEIEKKGGRGYSRVCRGGRKAVPGCGGKLEGLHHGHGAMER